jgi:hypothetical protein
LIAWAIARFPIIGGALTPHGVFVTIAFLLGLVFQKPWLAITGGQKMSNIMAKPNKADLLFLAEMLKAGQIIPVIEQLGMVHF